MRLDRLTIFVVLIGCKAASTTSSGTYSEDLTIHRPVFPENVASNDTPTLQSKEEPYTPLEGHLMVALDSIIQIASVQNKEGKYVEGFVIQVYSGTSRDEANAARFQMDKLFPDLSPKVSYHQPSFRVKGGKFTDRLEAHRMYKTVKAQFPRALLIPERFVLVYE